MAPAAPTPLDEITENFALFDGWEDRFAYLIDLGKQLPELPAQYHDEPHRVHGCQSNVWLHLGTDDARNVELLARSDAHIVNGLIAVLRSLYHGRPLADVPAVDAAATFRGLGLEEHLSPTRRNGLHAMVQRIRQLAEAKGNEKGNG